VQRVLRLGPVDREDPDPVPIRNAQVLAHRAVIASPEG
jgi:hypothetical protein